MLSNRLAKALRNVAYRSSGIAQSSKPAMGILPSDGLPIRPAGFCNVNNLFEVSINLASKVEILKGPSSARFGGNALHGAINFQSFEID